MKNSLRILSTFALLLALMPSSFAASVDFDLWQKVQHWLIWPAKEIELRLSNIKDGGDFRFECTLRPPRSIAANLRIHRIELDGESIADRAAILKNRTQEHEIIKIIYRPLEPLSPGYHAFVVKFGGAGIKEKTLFDLTKVDPELNVKTEDADNDRAIKYLEKLQRQRLNVKSLDSDFTLQTELTGKSGKISKSYIGGLKYTGEDYFGTILAAEPVIKVNGRIVHDKNWKDIGGKRKIGNILSLAPFQLAYYIPYSDLVNHYQWFISKKIGRRIWIIGTQQDYQVRLPLIIDLAIDEEKRVPVKIDAYVLSKEYVAASVVLEYDKNNLPVKQTLERRLPNGTHEKSVFELKNTAINTREPRKRGFLF